ncbi:MAG: hypothetical protein OXB93_03015 [Cytophagales bacterium]|nr:hypothetical protein [Cytophagales bacterium]
MSKTYTLEGQVVRAGYSERFPTTLEIYIMAVKPRRKEPELRKTVAMSHYGTGDELKKLDLKSKWLILTGFFTTEPYWGYVLVIQDYKIDAGRSDG